MGGNMDEKVVDKAMQIIMHAGDARLYCRKALDCLMEGNRGAADVQYQLAAEEITEAHRIQTDCIQGAVAGETLDYNVLFTHAQDTLMTIYSELKLANQIIAMYKKLDERIRKLESAKEGA